MPWALLFLAGLLEIGWAVGLKYSEGLSRGIGVAAFTLVAMVGSVVLLALAMKHIPLGTAYAVWTGIGAVGTAVLGIVLFGDAVTPMRVACLALIVLGIVGLKLAA